MVLFYLERIETLGPLAIGLQRPVPDYLRENVYYTGSGMNSRRYLRWTIEVVGVERIMFSADYPHLYEGRGTSRRFLAEAALSSEERELIAHGNWERLVAGPGPG